MIINWILWTVSVLIGTYLLALYTPRWRIFFFMTSWFISFFYVSWRITIIPVHHGWLSFLLGTVLYLCEIVSLITFLIFQYLFTGTYCPVKKDLTVYNNQKVPFVDILICTYNEPLYLLEMTMAAALNLNYPQERFCIYICDDGHREKLKELCQQYGIYYITRDNNHGAKAGNINHALSLTNGDLFAVLDADMIVQPDFLQKTVGYFINKNLAFVQTPQVYYNQDIYQYNLNKKIPNEQDFFMRDIQSARAAKNAVLHVGTNAVFRREYIMNIGNYPTCSITEDMAVGMILQAQGHDSMLINEELVYGLSATTLPELVKQRDRWCRGNLQVLRHFNPFTTKGLTLAQKIVYFDGVLYWFCNLQKMVFILCPLLFLGLGVTILEGSVLSLISFYFPYYLSTVLMTRLLSPHQRSLRWGHYYEIVMAPYLSISIITELCHMKNSFQVTSKEVLQNRHIFQYHLILGHLALFLFTIFAWIISFYRFQNHLISIFAYALNMFWSFYNMTGLIVAILIAWQKPIFRKTERISVQETVSLIYQNKKIDAKMTDLSAQGSGLKLLDTVSIPPEESLIMLWGELYFPCHSVRQHDTFLAICFEKLTPQQMRYLMKILCHHMSAYYDVGEKQKYQ